MIYRMLVCEPNRKYFVTMYDWNKEMFIDEANQSVMILSDMLDAWQNAEDFSFYEAYMPEKDAIGFMIVRKDQKQLFMLSNSAVEWPAVNW